jgi:hypothetical protein
MPATFSPFWLFKASGLALSQLFMAPALVLAPSKKCKDSVLRLMRIGHALRRPPDQRPLQTASWAVSYDSSSTFQRRFTSLAKPSYSRTGNISSISKL